MTTATTDGRPANGPRRFTDRAEAGRRLAERLGRELRSDTVVLAVPGGGVPVAVEVAAALGTRLAPLVVQRLAVPFQPDSAMAALGPGGALAVNAAVLHEANVDADELATEAGRARACAADRARRLLAGRPAPDIRGRPVIVVDDVIVTGATVRAACRAARIAGATRVLAAVPVAGEAGLEEPAAADQMIHLDTVADGARAGGRYADFRPVPDDEVVSLLAAADGRSMPSGRRRVADPPEEHGRLTVPPDAVGAVVLAHTSRRAEFGPRYRWIGGRLRDAGLATLSMNLLRPEEELDWTAACDVRLLADRLAGGLRRLRADATVRALPIGLFATGNAAAAALAVAARPARDPVAAVVCHDGRPDLAWRDLGRVRAPALLVAGGRDEHLAELNRAAYEGLAHGGRLAILRDAGRQLQEAGTLAALTELTGAWFVQWLTGRRAPSPGGRAG
ncbi:phosphoribosyltransferase family protein [Dactylosporangium sp. CA-233914]|uniref:phosphoribosyltransferase family protein n=1 Tax=Dactylosporangium sp. CA-233914 TaxID=3239934 RepID=UPI003D8D37FF